MTSRRDDPTRYADEPTPRRWLVVSVPAPPRGEEPLLVDALRRAGARAAEPEGERYAAYFAAPADVEPVLRRVEAAVRTATSLRDPELLWRWQSHEEWAERWARGVGARRVSDRVVVAPVGEHADAAEGDVVIRLVAGMAFGTAEHATTRACLRFLERLVQPGDRIADVGAGSGILSIAAALLGARAVLALEVDPLACELARRNAAANDVQDRVEVRQADVGPEDVARLGACDGIVANLGTEIIRRLLPGLPAGLGAGGWLILSGVPRGDRHEVVEAAAATALRLRDEAVEDGWWTAWFTRSGRESGR